MQLTKFGHACVRLEKGGTTLVVDPGIFTREDALRGADKVLITHEHPDHFDGERLREAARANPELEIWTNPAVASRLEDVGAYVHAVRHGDEFSAGAFGVRVFGENHAVIHRDLPLLTNVGFLVDGTVFYPGDALTVPEVPVDTLLVPTNAPWMKIGEMIDYLRDVRPTRAYSTHDGLMNENGLSVIDAQLERVGGEDDAEYRRLAPGTSVELS